MKRSMKRRWMSFLLAAVMVLGVCALCACGSSEPTFKTPQEHFDYVLDKNADLAKTAVEASAVGATLNTDAATTTVDAKLTVHNGLTSLLAMALSQSGQSIDLSFLKSIAVKISSIYKNGVTEEQIAVALSDVELLKAVIQSNTAENKMIFGVDPLFKKNYSIDLSTIETPENIGVSIDAASISQLGTIFEGFTKKGGLFDKIKELLPLFFTAPDQSEGEVTTQEISEKLTVFNTTISPDTIVAASNKAYEIFSADEKLKETLNSVSEKILGDLRDASKYKDQFPTVAVKVYVDDKNELRGCEVGIQYKETSYGTYKALYVEGKDQYAVELSASGVKDHSFSLLSKGEKVDGKLTGDFTVTLDGKKLCSFTVKDFDREAIKQGKLRGKFSIRVSDVFSVLEQFTDLSKLSSVRPFLAMLGEIYFEGRDDGMKLALSAPKNKDGTADDLLALDFTVSSTNRAELSTLSSEPMPKDGSILSLMSEGLPELMDRLQKAGIPVDLLSGLLGSGAQSDEQ